MGPRNRLNQNFQQDQHRSIMSTINAKSPCSGAGKRLSWWELCLPELSQPSQVQPIHCPLQFAMRISKSHKIDMRWVMNTKMMSRKSHDRFFQFSLAIIAVKCGAVSESTIINFFKGMRLHNFLLKSWNWINALRILHNALVLLHTWREIVAFLSFSSVFVSRSRERFF